MGQEIHRHGHATASKRDAVTPIWNDAKAGIIQNLRPGMWIYKKVDTTPKGQERKEFTATDWEPFEISLLSVPAGGATNLMSAAVTPSAPPTVVESQRASAHTEQTPDMELGRYLAEPISGACERDVCARQTVVSLRLRARR